jgi:hypothetical protein
VTDTVSENVMYMSFSCDRYRSLRVYSSLWVGGCLAVSGDMGEGVDARITRILCDTHEVELLS